MSPLFIGLKYVSLKDVICLQHQLFVTCQLDGVVIWQSDKGQKNCPPKKCI